MKRFAAFVTGAAMIATQPVFAQMGAPGERPTTMPAVAGPLAVKYKADADRILQAATADLAGCDDLLLRLRVLRLRLRGVGPGSMRAR